MKTILFALFVVGCGDAAVSSPLSNIVTRDLWIDHGHPDACHGSIAIDNSAAGTWDCYPYGGAVTGWLMGNALSLNLSPFHVNGIIREYDGAIIGRTNDDRPFVAYLR